MSVTATRSSTDLFKRPETQALSAITAATDIDLASGNDPVETHRKINNLIPNNQLDAIYVRFCFHDFN